MEKKGFPFGELPKEYHKAKIPLEEFENKAKAVRDKEIELLSNYIEISRLEKEFKEYYEVQTWVMYIYALLNYPENFAYYNKVNQDSLQLTGDYRKYRQYDHLVNEKYLISAFYIEMLRQFSFEKAKDFKKIPMDSFTRKTFNPYHKLLIDSIKGRTQEYVMARWLLVQLEHQSILDSFIYEKFKAIAKEKITTNAVTEVVDKHKEKQALKGKPLNKIFRETQVMDTLGNIFSFGKLIEQFKGKTIYIDIWASWCGPCRQYMIISKKLEKKLSELPIEFVFLTIDDMSKKHWSEIYKITQTNKNQYCLKNGFDSDFLKFLEIGGVPHYMIIKDGILVEYNAIHPCNSLEKILSELANK